LGRQISFNEGLIAIISLGHEKNTKMEKYLQLKCGMNFLEVSKLLIKEISLENLDDDCSYFELGNYLTLYFRGRKLDAILFNELFPLTVDGIKISMEKRQIEKTRGLPEITYSIPGKAYWIYDKDTTIYEFDQNEKLLSIFKVESKLNCNAVRRP
jgi:hypothetical protein